MLPKIKLGSEYLVLDSGTSDGTQVKYYKDNNWYKIDRYGGEGQAEELVSNILSFSNLDKCDFVEYSQIVINDEMGCVSKNFLAQNEDFITIYRLYSNINGGDLAKVTSMMDYDEAIDFVLDFVDKNAQVDLREYLANTFSIDELILNEDRHFNNLGLIYDGNGFRPAPIFDNGKSLFIGNTKYDLQKSIKENKKIAFAKAFSGSFELNKSYLKKYCTIEFDFTMIQNYLKERLTGDDDVYSRLSKLIEIRS
ncbi:MAG: hypothetical protein IJ675_02535 [Pseudobutyrivibrio sp.]|nr:hypothetical protein [Pseudobutyrivibrio sp.]